MPSKYDPETRAKAVRLVLEHRGDYPSEWAAIKAVSSRLGMNAETLRNWIRQQQVDDGQRDGVRLRSCRRDPRTEAPQSRAGRDRGDLEGRDVFLRAGERPATPLICQFIAEHKDRFGVAPLCRVLTEHGCKIAPRTFYAWVSRAPSKRSLWDAAITEVLAGYYEPDEHGCRKPESLYGSVKMWAHLRREGIPVAKSTVERLMRANGWQGVRRQKKVRTTISDPAAERAPDLVDRRFAVPAPNRLLVADFTYVKLICGVFVYVAFVIDAYAGTIVGWERSASKQTRFVESAIRQAVALRSRQGHPIDGAIHHSDAGSQYTSVHFGETLSLSGLRPSIGSVGDAFDNALAETTIGLYKNECIRADSPFRRGPLRTPGDVELITADYVSWYNHQRLMHRLGRIPPAEAEAHYYAQHVTDQPAGSQKPEGA